MNKPHNTLEEIEKADCIPAVQTALTIGLNKVNSLSKQRRAWRKAANKRIKELTNGSNQGGVSNTPPDLPEVGA